jgi:hypothetical protein
VVKASVAKYRVYVFHWKLLTLPALGVISVGAKPKVSRDGKASPHVFGINSRERKRSHEKPSVLDGLPKSVHAISQ